VAVPGLADAGLPGPADPAAPLRLEPTEISQAQWFTRTQIRAAAATTRTSVSPFPAVLDRPLPDHHVAGRLTASGPALALTGRVSGRPAG